MGSTLYTVLLAGFAAAAAGLFLAAALLEEGGEAARRTRGLALGGVLALGAVLASAVAPLGRPSLVFAVFSNPSTALFRELTTSLAAIVLALLYAGAIERRAYVETCRTLARLLAAAGLLVAASAASSFVMPWRAAWRSAAVAFPLALLPLAAGVLLARWTSASPEAPLRLLGRTVARPLEAASALLLAATLWLLVCLDEGFAAKALTGDAAFPFWAFVAAGIVLPTLLGRRKHRAAAGAAALSALAAGFLYPVFLYALVESETVWRFFTH